MRVRAFLFLIFVGLALTSFGAASAQKLKNVSPTKYETRGPAKNFTFHTATPLAKWRRVFEHQDILFVSYRSDDKSDWLYGILDQRGKRPKWLLQPHYEDIRELGKNSLTAQRIQYSDDKVCVLNLIDGICQETDFNSSSQLNYDGFPALPDWVQPYALYAKTDRKYVYDVQLFWTNERPLTIVRNVLRAPGNRRPLAQTFALGDRLAIRTVDAAGQVRDAILTRNEDGTVSIEYQPAFSVIEIQGVLNPVRDGKVDWAANTAFRDFIPMQTANAELGLVWPIYELGDGPAAMPEGMLGLLPLTFRYSENRIASGRFNENEVAAWYCCEFPLIWAVAWEAEDGVAYAVIPQIEVPSFEAVLASRQTAIYSEIEQLWEPGPNVGYNARNASARGELIGKYALHRRDGMVDIITGDKYATETGSTMIVETSVPEQTYSAWLMSAMQAEAKRQADATASFNAWQEQKRARKEAHRQALAEQSLRLARERQAARDARQAELDAAAAAREAARGPRQWTEKVYGSWAIARVGYCNTNTWQTDLYAEANAKKACRDRGGNPGVTYVVGNGYDPFAPSADRCYSAQAVTECELTENLE